MGFLTGAYGKLMAGKLVRQLQVEMTQIQSQLRRATKEVGIFEKQMQAQQRMDENCIRQQAQMSSAFAQGSMLRFLQGETPTLNPGIMDKLNNNKDLNETEKVAYEAYQTQQRNFQGIQMQAQMNYQMNNQQMQSQMQMQLSMIQDNYEMSREAMLQPLKDLEEQLQTEKDNLESRLKIAQAEYDAKKEEEKAGVKSLAPDYTGQGQ